MRICRLGGIGDNRNRYSVHIRKNAGSDVAFRQQKVLPFGIIGTVSVVGFNGQTLSIPNPSFAATDVSVVLRNSLPPPDIDASCRQLGRTNEYAIATAHPVLGGEYLLLVVMASGCCQLRFRRLTPRDRAVRTEPTSTTLRMPGHVAESSHLQSLRERFDGMPAQVHSKDPQQSSQTFRISAASVRRTADATRMCRAGSATAPGGCNNGPVVPSPQCNGSCKNGPPAVLFGDECRLRDTSPPAQQRQAWLHPAVASKDRRAGRR